MWFKFIEPLDFTLRQTKTALFIMVSMFGYYFSDIETLPLVWGWYPSVSIDIIAGIDMFRLAMSIVINSFQVLV